MVYLKSRDTKTTASFLPVRIVLSLAEGDPVAATVAGALSSVGG